MARENPGRHCGKAWAESGKHGGEMRQSNTPRKNRENASGTRKVAAQSIGEGDTREKGGHTTWRDGGKAVGVNGCTVKKGGNNVISLTFGNFFTQTRFGGKKAGLTKPERNVHGTKSHRQTKTRTKEDNQCRQA